VGSSSRGRTGRVAAGSVRATSRRGRRGDLSPRASGVVMIDRLFRSMEPAFLSAARCAANSGSWGCSGRGGFHSPRRRKPFPVCRHATASRGVGPNQLSTQNRQSLQCSCSSAPFTFCSPYPSWHCQQPASASAHPGFHLTTSCPRSGEGFPVPRVEALSRHQRTPRRIGSGCAGGEARPA
jgi:hypothetical protein